MLSMLKVMNEVEVDDDNFIVRGAKKLGKDIGDFVKDDPRAAVGITGAGATVVGAGIGTAELLKKRKELEKKSVLAKLKKRIKKK